ncbi:hypothetical protein [Amycolatopsis sp. NPDC004378]
MPDHRGLVGRAKIRTVLVVVATLALVGVGSVVVVRANAQQPGETQAQVLAYGQSMTGMQLDSAAEAAEAESVAGAGPVTELDKTFLVKVRQAGLWDS